MSTPLEIIVQLAQKCISEVPVVVLGSGTSLQYGVGGMNELGDWLDKNVLPSDADEKVIWGRFVADIRKNGDLEGALHRVSLPLSLEGRVVEETRKIILRGDQKVFADMVGSGLRLALTGLLGHLLRTTHSCVIVVTTNYDRLAEYAADQAGVFHSTGFSHGYWRTFSDFSAAPRKCVEILKVHGSLDWFLDANQIPIALPDALPPPLGFVPVMVTPGIGKYAKTHDDPFRTIITRADAAFASARSIMSVGYGFRDRHIQPKMQRRISNDRIPSLFLARALSPEIRAFLKPCTNPHYLALEQSGPNTRAYFAQAPDGVEIPGALWNLENFLAAAI